MKGRWVIGLVVAVSWPMTAMAADTLPPTTPTNFQSTTQAGKLVIALSWTASTDAGGIRGYRLDRSLDQANWDVLVPATNESTYQDAKVGSGLHYFYRLTATDTSNNVSVPAFTDARAPSLTDDEAASVTPGGTFSSFDNLVQVSVPDGATESAVTCTVTARSLGNGQKPSGGRTVILGPYTTACKTADGTEVTSFSKPLTWSFSIKSKLKNRASPVLYAYRGSEAGKPLTGGQYDSQAQTVSAAVPVYDTVAVVATVPQGISPSLILVILIVFALVGLVVWLVLRRKKRLDYEEYLRSKYYEL